MSRLLLSLAILILTLPMPVRADEADLGSVQNVALPDLQKVICVAISADGKFLYSASAGTGAILIFTRDLETGQLTLADSIKAPILSGPKRIRLSTDQKYAAVADDHGSTALIFKRDATSGGLTKVADAGKGLDGVTDAILSPDNHFLYTASYSGISIFKFTDDQLTLVEFEKAGDNLKGMRPMALSKDGHWLYAVGEFSGTLVAFRRNEESGKLERKQTLKNGEDDVSTLRGAYRVAVSGDGKQVYVSSGRTQGDQAVTAFTVEEDGLKLLQQFVNGADDFSEFEGGNEVTVSPRGKWVAAVASVSDRLFCFRRDPTTGKLTFVTSAQAENFITEGASGVCVSPDDKFVYVADQNEGQIEVFKLP
jgi:6-phosphogluconolactonase (cycloisomerase 2 family)